MFYIFYIRVSYNRKKVFPGLKGNQYMQKFEFCFEKFLSQKVEKELKYLFVSHLLYLEELAERGVISSDEYQSKRKEILDKGNAAIRNTQDQIDSIFSNLQLV